MQEIWYLIKEENWVSFHQKRGAENIFRPLFDENVEHNPIRSKFKMIPMLD